MSLCVVLSRSLDATVSAFEKVSRLRNQVSMQAAFMALEVSHSFESAFTVLDRACMSFVTSGVPSRLDQLRKGRGR